MLQWMLNLSIIKKMILLVGTLLVLLIGVAGYSVLKMNLVAKEVAMIAHENMPLIKMSSSVVIKQLESEIALEKAFRAAELHSSEEQSVEHYLRLAVQLHQDINQDIKSSEQLLANADQLAVTEYDKQRFRALEQSMYRIEEAHQAYLDNVTLFEKQFAQGASATQLVHLLEQLEVQQKQINRQLIDFTVELETMTQDSVNLTEEIENNALLGLLILASVSLIFGLAMGLFISRATLTGVRKIRDAAAKMEQGQFDFTLSVDSRDELGQLAQSINKTVTTLSGLLAEVNDRAVNISSMATELASISDDNQNAVVEQQSNTEQIATAMAQIAATVTELAASAEGASHNSDVAQQRVQQCDDLMQKMVEEISSLVNNAQHASQSILAVQESTEQIHQFINVVSAIAEQTNLLALNASIEAARAGEQGRGFAVVADEVRALANRSQEATSEIGGLIDNLVRSAKMAHDDFKTNHDTTISSSSKVAQSQDMLASIRHAIEELSQASHQVAVASEQQSVTIEDMNVRITSVKDKGDVVLQGATHSTSACHSLSEDVVVLKTLIGQFKTQTVSST
ncbi:MULTISPECIES: methyl-accepting chemotaxis protein [unclassified Vibrio]|uniref:Methyl-accepting chemotaxis protein n=1 Tax=Vibrio sp. HB236076 TaxID=3232307 RepID=A0AB39HEY6_9VIBR|nr:methyl-accepting chemotaxis protein [Vibrio sp. HB161653]MDP5253115.1 methyl-accepting chemotaxis protein [Vibrio sp. HB161653]